MDERQFAATFEALRSQEASTRPRFRIDWGDRLAVLDEDTPQTGFDRHYVYHVAWALRTLRKIDPAHHHDFSSILYFVVAASSMTPVTFHDLRPANLQLDNLTTRRADLTALQIETGSLDSVSCMHVVEHIGLGRYGDTLDYDGDLKAIGELKRVIKPGGSLMFVVPVGRESLIQFNAHRIYAYEEVIRYFQPEFDVVEHALIPETDLVGLVPSPPAALVAGQRYACGCFWFRKRAI